LALALAACGGHVGVDNASGIVPWLGQPGASWIAADGTAAASCNATDVSIPPKLQKWGGVWHDQATGMVGVQNNGPTACEISPPTAIHAMRDGNDLAAITVPADFAARPVLLPPGDAVYVGVAIDNGCTSPQVTSDAFSFEFPGTGTITVSPAVLDVQCGGALNDFEDSGLATAPTTGEAALQASITTPPSSVSGKATTTYQVTLTNPTNADISLSNCPAYQEGIKGEAASNRVFQLNCGGAGSVIHAHDTVTFQIKLPPFAHSGGSGMTTSTGG